MAFDGSSGVTLSPVRGADMRRRKNLALAAASAVVGFAGYQSMAEGATVNWTGHNSDPLSASYSLATTTLEFFTPGDPVHVWNTTVQNWANGATYAVGDDVVFTDNFSCGKFIRLSSSNLNPASMTFKD